MKSALVFVLSLVLALLETGCQAKRDAGGAQQTQGSVSGDAAFQSEDYDTVPESTVRYTADDFSYAILILAYEELKVERHRHDLSRKKSPGEAELARLDLESAMKSREAAAERFQKSKDALKSLMSKMEQNNQLDSLSYVDNFVKSSESWLSKVKYSEPEASDALMRNPPHY